MAFTLSGDVATTRTNLGLGDAATKTTGTASGNIPVLDSSGKIPSSTVDALPSGGSVGQVVTNTAAGTGTWQDATGAITGGTSRTYSVGATNYESRTFYGSGDIYFPANKVVDFLMIGGGGSGGQYTTSNANGGGGAGGVVLGTGYTLPAGSYNVKVGKGAEHVAYGSISRGVKGEDTHFGTFVAMGGGGGGSQGRNNVAPKGPQLNGGCGGGLANTNTTGIDNSADQDSYSGTANVTGYGFAGGTAGQNWTGAGGGGAGGAGQAGNDATNTSNGRGGAGITNTYEDGTDKFVAGGGGGGGNSTETAGDGYNGGGRGVGTTKYYSAYTYTDEINGTTKGSGTPDGVTNTGGGGGGGSYWAGDYWANGSGSGGSGIVVIRWIV